MLKLQEPYNQFSEHDEKTLASLADRAYGDMCEIGCWQGHSTSILARRVKAMGQKLYVVDNFKGNFGTPLIDYALENDVRTQFIDNMKEMDLWDSIVLLHMDSAKAAAKIGYVSFLFVDAGHTYVDVISDLTNYKDKVNGIICGHDYESETYEEQYTNEDYVNGKHHGVIKAVNEVFGKVEHEGRMWWVDH